MPELGKMSRRGHRQVLLDKLTWLLCKRVQSLQVRAELLHSPHGDLAASFRAGWFFFPFSKSEVGPGLAYRTKKYSVALLLWDSRKLVLAYLFL